MTHDFVLDQTLLLAGIFDEYSERIARDAATREMV